ncbi:hypothetical protein QM012_000916 [Aureobasidium pullulans]|uniref:Bromo domain-containing protein n=1 Tax=Aureobasidium pullulans TaxID=5580 RepID=A0ABR0TGB8_AURPU
MSHLTDGRRSQLEYKFCRQVVEDFLNSSEDYVVPFLEPVDEEADGAPDYYTIIELPMDLSTILQRVDSRKIAFYFTEVRSLFFRMFSNCYEYNSPEAEVYQKAKIFERAFSRVWEKRHDWIMAEITKSHENKKAAEGDKTNDSSGSGLHGTSGNDAIQNIDGPVIDNSENNGTSGEDVPSGPRPSISPTDHSTENDRPKTPRHQSRARQEDGSEQQFDNDNTTNTLNHNRKRLSESDSTTGTSTPSSPQQQPLMTGQQTQKQIDNTATNLESWVEQGPAKRPRLEPGAESPSQTPTQQPPTQQPVETPLRQPTPNENPTDPYQAFVSNIVTEQITSFVTHISAGEFSEDLRLWSLLCRNEQCSMLERI